jgi:hypothetical protein
MFGQPESLRRVNASTVDHHHHCAALRRIFLGTVLTAAQNFDSFDPEP